MALRYLRSGVVAAVIAGGATAGLASAQQRDGGLLPPGESGMVTVAGCLVRGNQVRDGDSDKFVLANPKTGPMSNAPAETCTVEASANAVQLDNPEKGNVNESMLGRWVEISGRLEKETSTDNILRELDVTSARLLPFEAPRAAAAEPAPEPAAANQAPEPAPAPQAAAPEPSPAPQAAAPAQPAPPAPVATSGQAGLPDTASVGPLTGLIGLFACSAGMVLRSFRSRRLN
jgi:hypothetical protein